MVECHVEAAPVLRVGESPAEMGDADHDRSSLPGNSRYLSDNLEGIIKMLERVIHPYLVETLRLEWIGYIVEIVNNLGH